MIPSIFHRKIPCQIILGYIINAPCFQRHFHPARFSPRSSVIGYRSSVIGHRLSVIGYRLSVIYRRLGDFSKSEREAGFLFPGGGFFTVARGSFCGGLCKSRRFGSRGAEIGANLGGSGAELRRFVQITPAREPWSGDWRKSRQLGSRGVEIGANLANSGAVET